MEDVVEFCERVMGAGAEASEAAREALSATPDDHVALLAAASRACRTRTPAIASVESATSGPATLTEAVASELAAATATLPERQREALALRELAGLSYRQMAAVMGIGDTAVPLLLARARLGLREARRGAPLRRAGDCDERERALRALAHRHDREPCAESELGWLEEHLAACRACTQAHAMMLEASLCYRAWQPRAARITESESDPEEAVPAPESARDFDHRAPRHAEVVAFEASKPSWWHRLTAALAADARR